MNETLKQSARLLADDESTAEILLKDASWAEKVLPELLKIDASDDWCLVLGSDEPDAEDIAIFEMARRQGCDDSTLYFFEGDRFLGLCHQIILSGRKRALILVSIDQIDDDSDPVPTQQRIVESLGFDKNKSKNIGLFDGVTFVALKKH